MFLCCFPVLTNLTQAQTSDPVKIWDQTYGGTAVETDVHAIPTADEGYLIASSSQSGIGGTKTSKKYGSWDWWVFKTDSDGKVEWDFSLGGASEDGFRGAAVQTEDGHYVLAGHVTVGQTDQITSPSLGSRDILLVKLDAETQEILWQERVGGNGVDIPYDLVVGHDGSLYVTGFTTSTDIENYPNRGSLDLLLAKVSHDGNTEWVKTYGGSGFESADRMVKTKEGHLIIGGYSTSTDLSTPNNGDFDYWLLKIDEQGSVLWDALYGGAGLDAVRALAVDHAGNIVAGGESFSGAEGAKTTESRGAQDMWLIKTDPNGVLIWDKTYGGTGNEQAQDLWVTRDDQIIFGGYSNSGLGQDKTIEGFGGYDLWYLQADQDGELNWQDVVGGQGLDAGFNVVDYNTSLDQLTIAGQFEIGNSGNIEGMAYGVSDIVLAKTQLHRFNATTFTVEVHNTFDLEILSGIEEATYLLKNTDGKQRSTGIFNGSSLILNSGIFEEEGIQELNLYYRIGYGSDTLLRTITVNVTKDVTAPVITVDPVTPDNLVDRVDWKAGVFMTGTAIGAEDGQVLTVKINGKKLRTTVKDGKWSVELPRFAIRPWRRPNYFKITVEDKAGNSAEPYYGQFIADLSVPKPMWAKKFKHWKGIRSASFQVEETDMLVEPNEISSLGLEIRLYPNPATDLLKIDLRGIEGKVDFNMLDQQGRAAITKRFRGGNIEELNITNLAPGIYIARMNTLSGIVIRRIQVTR